MTHSFTETYDRPQRAAERAATADATTEEPLDVDGKSLLEHGVDPHHSGAVLLWRHTRLQPRRELAVESVAETEPEMLLRRKGREMDESLLG